MLAPDWTTYVIAYMRRATYVIAYTRRCVIDFFDAFPFLRHLTNFYWFLNSDGKT